MQTIEISFGRLHAVPIDLHVTHVTVLLAVCLYLGSLTLYYVIPRKRLTDDDPIAQVKLLLSCLS